mgnify:CR=1 FL=1
MSRLATSFVLGFHGCDATVATRAVTEGQSILQSSRDYDWLGPGAYFWESDPLRAKEWADWKVSRGDYARADVVGAVIDLRNCLDLSNREDIDLLRGAHASFEKLQTKAGLPLPVNQNLSGDPHEDLLLRYLDCAVLRHLHQTVTAAGLEPYDSVRGMFIEGGAAFPGSGIARKTHTQIAVISADCIRGLFRPLLDGHLQFPHPS